MTDAAPAVFVALEQSGFDAAIRQSPWLYPAANVGHIISLTLFAGAVAVMDVRLLGGLNASACQGGNCGATHAAWSDPSQEPAYQISTRLRPCLTPSRRR